MHIPPPPSSTLSALNNLLLQIAKSKTDSLQVLGFWGLGVLGVFRFGVLVLGFGFGFKVLEVQYSCPGPRFQSSSQTGRTPRCTCARCQVQGLKVHRCKVPRSKVPIKQAMPAGLPGA